MTAHHQYSSKFVDRGIIYPDSDGKPMADNTLQAFWIVMLYNNLKGLFDGQETFVAADLFWYPVEGDPLTKVAPDILVALGRPEGHRGSYKQWMEDDIAPQVVFEVLSPSNSKVEMITKRDFYEQFGAKEFIIIDPDKGQFVAYQTIDGKMTRVSQTDQTWQSSLLGIGFYTQEDKLMISYPDGTPFKTFQEIQAEKEAAIEEKETAIEEKIVAIEEKKKALEAEEATRKENEHLKALLRKLGHDVE